MRHPAFRDELTRSDLIDWYRDVRARTRSLFALISDDAYYDRPIALRNPFVFYEGHFAAFAVNTIVKLALKQPGVDQKLELLFERGIDPEVEAAAGAPYRWPERGEVTAYVEAAEKLIEAVLSDAVLEDESVPQLRGGEAILAVLEHEQMHHETLLYMIHALPYEKKQGTFKHRDTEITQRSSVPPSDLSASVFKRSLVPIPAGVATLGAPRGEAFGWDNEFPETVVDVPVFEIDQYPVTNGEYLEYVEATAASAPHFWMRDASDWCWRGMFGLLPLPLDRPVWVTHDEAHEFAAWRGKRLPTEAEFHRAAFGTPSGEERLQPWGNELPDATRGNFDFVAWDPLPAGSHPSGGSAWGVHDLVGNGWEWTASVFDGFEGFEPMPSYPLYSADFFDGSHFVLKGASPVTARHLVRRSFRNWFRPRYPYVFAKFRCVG